jgi:hypothetical protein
MAQTPVAINERWKVAGVLQIREVRHGFDDWKPTFWRGTLPSTYLSDN